MYELFIYLVFLSFYALISCIFSYIYLLNKKKTYLTSFIYQNIFYKYSIYLLSYICQIQNDDIELLSYSSIASVYLYIVELIISGIKKLFPLKTLIIIQTVFSTIIVIFGLLLLVVFCYEEVCRRLCNNF